MTKKTLKEAAKEILDASKANAGSDSFGAGKTLTPGGPEVIDLGGPFTKPGEEHPDYTRGVPRAKPPGATPPLGAQPMQKLETQPQQTMGKGSNEDPTGEDREARDDAHVNRKKVAPPTKVTKEVGVGKTVEGTEDKEKDVVAEIVQKHATNMSEDVKALLNGENLSEEFLAKATTIFETAVLSRVKDIQEELETAFETQLEEAVETIKEELVEATDEMLNYMVAEWVEENQLQIETGIRTEIAESLLNDIKNVFESHYVTVPEEKADAFDELSEELQETKNELNEQIKKGIELTKELNEAKKFQIIASVTEGLTVTQAEKVRSLAETVDFTSTEDFTNNVKILKDHYFPETKTKVGTKDVNSDPVDLDEGVVPEQITKNPEMQQYLKSLSRITT